MNKIAIFVEGKTERLFLNKLLYNRYANVLVREVVLKGKNPYFQTINVSDKPGIECLFVVVEAPDLNKLLTMVAYNAENLVNNFGYIAVIGLRDLIPNKKNEKISVINVINRRIRMLSVWEKTSIILSVMETEAWFLYDHLVFERIDTRLSPEKIKEALGIDLEKDDPETEYSNPKKIIDSIMRLAELRYRKHEDEINRIVGNIDFNNMCSCTGKIDSFLRLINKIDTCVIT